MNCGKFNAYVIRKQKARSAKDLAAVRAAMRRHVEHCEFCQKELNKNATRRKK